MPSGVEEVHWKFAIEAYHSLRSYRALLCSKIERKKWVKSREKRNLNKTINEYVNKYLQLRSLRKFFRSQVFKGYLGCVQRAKERPIHHLQQRKSMLTYSSFSFLWDMQRSCEICCCDLIQEIQRRARVEGREESIYIIFDALESAKATEKKRGFFMLRISSWKSIWRFFLLVSLFCGTS